jgi:hypothetical protein
MANLSGLTKLVADKIEVRKPNSTAPRQNIFDVFVRSPEAFSSYQNQNWDPLDNLHIGGVQDIASYVADAVTSGVVVDYDRIETDVEAWMQQPDIKPLFTGEKGDKGDTGEQGIAGAQGPPGIGATPDQLQLIQQSANAAAASADAAGLAQGAAEGSAVAAGAAAGNADVSAAAAEASATAAAASALAAEGSALAAGGSADAAAGSATAAGNSAAAAADSATAAANSAAQVPALQAQVDTLGTNVGILSRNLTSVQLTLQRYMIQYPLTPP